MISRGRVRAPGGKPCTAMATEPVGVAFAIVTWIGGLSCPGARLTSPGPTEMSAFAGVAIAARTKAVERAGLSHVRLAAGDKEIPGPSMNGLPRRV